MKILTADPPNIGEIDAAFRVRGQAVFFAYGDTIYNPSGNPIPAAIIEHEKVHLARQAGIGPEEWWRRYIADKRFRLDEEIPAHRAEFAYWQRQPGILDPVPGFRSKLEFHRLRIAQRLSSPLYGSMVSTSEAKRLICAPS